ncbi:MAG TPA: butyrate kinase [Bacteroidales bacterium]|nr:butyrate kinase [Bacteroidales bacterium]HPS72862.1 butyrate kinase [Bacteroidales bacterium]
MPKRVILTINPGSTSTKIALFHSNEQILLKNIKHPVEELDRFQHIIDQFSYRKDMILKELENANIDFHSIEIIVGRGGLVKPIQSGVYQVNERLKEDLRIGVQGQHASNLGGLIADDLAKNIPGARAFIADPVVVDELESITRLTGIPQINKHCVFHALNHKAIGRIYASSIGRKYEELNLIIAHLGGGISVGAHRKGKVIDVNQALDGDGPFTPERSGTLPVGDLVRLCFSGKYTREEILKLITGKGGFVAYLGTNNACEVEKMAHEGNTLAMQVLDALAYQVAKEIGAMSVVLEGKVDAILITGGMAHSNGLVAFIRKMTEHIAHIEVYPGEDEMRALAMNGLRVLEGEEALKIYE